MSSLPKPGSDSGTWGDILNDYLNQEHNSDGSLKNVVRPSDTRLTDSRTPTDGSVTDAKISAGGLSPSKITGTVEVQSNKDTDITLAANSDTKYPSQKAIKTYADTKSTLALGETSTTAFDGLRGKAAYDTALLAGGKSLVNIGDASPFLAQFTDITHQIIGIDDGNCVWGVSNGGIYVSTNGGTTWSGNKGLPANTTLGVSCGKIIKQGSTLVLLCRDESADRWKIYTSPYSSDNTALVWTARLTLAVGATGTIGTCMNRAPSGAGYTTTGIWLGEYGDPVGGPSIYFSAAGTSWATKRAADPAMRHIHAIACDPYVPGQLFASCGDGLSTNTIMRSTDYGTTWSNYIASAAWQGVQISFTSAYIFLAGDNSRCTLIVIDRVTGTPYVASPNWHYNIAVAGGGAGDRYFSNAFFGTADAVTGHYYCMANDIGTGVGNYAGLFWLPKPGLPIQPLEIPAAAGATGYWGEFFIITTNLYVGTKKRPLLRSVSFT